MAPRRKKKQPEFILLTKEDLQTREVEYKNRVKDATVSLRAIEKATKVVENAKEQQRLLEKWRKYSNCEKLPKPYIPSDIREFFVRLRFAEAASSEKTIDWVLSVNELSKLSQDTHRIDRTRKTLSKTIRPEFGKEYEQYIDFALEILKNIEMYLADKQLVKHATPRILNDIIEQRTSVQQEIYDFFDRYTYRVITSGGSYMKWIDPQHAEYIYESPNFKIHIWTIQDIPIRFRHMELPYDSVNLHQLNIELRIPRHALSYNLTLRGLHLNFDHFSEYAKSAEEPLGLPTDEVSGGMYDLRNNLLREWQTEKDIMEQKQSILVQKRLDYEEKMRAYEDSMTKSKNPEKKIKKIKYPKEEILIDPDMYPDVRNEFLANEEKEFQAFMNSVYHPNVLRLNSYEINLRKYNIVGGIYQLFFVDKPEHTHYDFKKFNVTRHLNNGNLHIKREITVNIDNLQNANDNNAKESTSAKEEQQENSELFMLAFKLPKYLCLWGEPIACHFESNFDGIVGAMSETQLVTDDLLNETHLNGLILQDHELHAEDFNLNMPLTKNQIFDLYRYCSPFIIASYKFAREIDDLFDQKIEAMLHETDIDVTSLNDCIIYEGQTNPERCFPLFPATLAVQGEFTRILNAFEPQSFHELIKALELIKNVYKQKYMKLLQMKPFKPKQQVTKSAPLLNSKKDQILVNPSPAGSSTGGRRSFRSKSGTKLSGSTTKRLSPVRISIKKSIDISKQDSESFALRKRKSPSKHMLTKRSHKHIEEDGGTNINTEKFAHWTTEHIFHSILDKETCMVTIWTDRLGTIGFATKRYEHFPFKFWSVEPGESSEIIVTIITQHVKCVISVTADGFRAHVTDPTDKYVRNPTMYLVINEPIKDLLDLEKRFQEANINIFTNFDAKFYIPEGYFSEKHLAAEIHTYCCMAANANVTKFGYSPWNRLGTRRDLILRFGYYKDTEDDMLLVHITPEGGHFVTIKELCADNLNVFDLEYTLTWRNITTFSDLHHMIASVGSLTTGGQSRDSKVIYFLKKLLCKLRLLSFS